MGRSRVVIHERWVNNRLEIERSNCDVDVESGLHCDFLIPRSRGAPDLAILFLPASLVLDPCALENHLASVSKWHPEPMCLLPRNQITSTSLPGALFMIAVERGWRCLPVRGEEHALTLVVRAAKLKVSAPNVFRADPFRPARLRRGPRAGATPRSSSSSVSQRTPQAPPRGAGESPATPKRSQRSQASTSSNSQGLTSPVAAERAAAHAMILASIPGMTVTTGRALVARFGSIAALSRATRDELSTVHGVGKARASEIHNFFNHSAPKQ